MVTTSWSFSKCNRRADRPSARRTRVLGVEQLDLRATPAVGFGSAFHIGDIGQEMAYGLTADPAGNTLVTGHYRTVDADGVDFDPGLGIVNRAANPTDVTPFVARYSAAGTLNWVWSPGATGGGSGRAVALDGQGNVYATGYFHGTMDFDPANTYADGRDLLTAQGNDAYVLKLNAGGSFAWVARLGDPDPNMQDIGSGIAVDGAGRVYVSTGSGYVAFVARFSAQGAKDWEISYRGPDSTPISVAALALDAQANVHVTGEFFGKVDFDPGPGSYVLGSGGRNNWSGGAFVLKLNSAGNFLWARNFATVGAFGGCGGSAIAVDTAGNVYTAGSGGSSVDYDPGKGKYVLAGSFLSKLNSSGNFVWAKQLGGEPHGLTLDGNGNIYISGQFQETIDVDPGPGTYLLTNTLGGVDSYLMKLNAAGNFVWATQLGGAEDQRSEDIAVDSQGNVYVTGFYGGTVDFDPTGSVYDLTSNGGEDFFLLKLTQF